jgi:adenosylcobinamide kinase / adenosylcobinamide-phosphate guanylyltransferase
MERLPQRTTTSSPASTLPRVSLILGGARSGKSAYAEQLIVTASGGGIYLATAEPRDPEMSARIAEHRKRRGEAWRTIEAPRDIVGPLRTEGGPILIDCLTLWVSNLIEAEADLDREYAELGRCLNETKGPVVLVSNEVGLGIVPDNALARRFRDAAGRLNQQVAEHADQVVFVAAGLPMRLK